MLPQILFITMLSAGDGRVILRDRAAESIPDVVAISPAGASVKGGSTPRVIPWQRVLRIEGALAAQADPYLTQGEDLWRALARLDRGDLPAAEAILERLTGPIATTPGPTAEAIAWGLMRCRLERGAQVAAAAAWISWIEVRDPTGAPPTAPPGIALTPDGSGLVAAIPPIWVNIPSVAVMASGNAEPWQASGQPDGSPGSLLKAWYVRAARGACGLPLGELPPESNDAGVALVAAIVEAQYGDEITRLKSREILRATMSQRPDAWIEAWCRVAIGRSMQQDKNTEVRRLGVVELMHVPARLEGVTPYVTGIALADGAAALRSMGDLDGATRLRDELARRYAGHPGLDWAMVRDWPKTSTTTAPAPSEAAPP